MRVRALDQKCSSKISSRYSKYPYVEETQTGFAEPITESKKQAEEEPST